jgi:hypothetical protein
LYFLIRVIVPAEIDGIAAASIAATGTCKRVLAYLDASSMCSPAVPTSLPKPRTVLQLAPKSANRADPMRIMTMRLRVVFMSETIGMDPH